MTTPVQPGDIPTDLTVPQRGDPPAIFTPQYQTFLDRMNDEVVPSMNALSAYFNESNTYVAQQVSLAADQVVLAADQVALAEAQVTLATQEADRAKDSADKSAASANFVGDWSDLTGVLAFPSSVYHDGNYWLNLVEIPDVTLSEPSLTNSDYSPISNSDIRFNITTPFTITRSGKYFIKGSGNVTLPPLSSLVDSNSFEFMSEVGQAPTILGNTATDILTDKLGLVDGIILNEPVFATFIYNSNSGKLEI